MSLSQVEIINWMGDGEHSRIQKKSKTAEIFHWPDQITAFFSQPQITLTKSDYAVLKNNNLGPEKSTYCNGYVENTILVRELRKIFWALEILF